MFFSECYQQHGRWVRVFHVWVVDPCMTVDPNNALHWSGVLHTSFGGHRTFLTKLTFGWPQLIPEWLSTPNNALYSDQGFFQPHLEAIGLCWAILPLIDPDDLRPQQCIMLWSWVLHTKFGGCRAFLRRIDLWMTFDFWLSRFEILTTNLGARSKFQIDA